MFQIIRKCSNLLQTKIIDKQVTQVWYAGGAYDLCTVVIGIVPSLTNGVYFKSYFSEKLKHNTHKCTEREITVENVAVSPAMEGGHIPLNLFAI